MKIDFLFSVAFFQINGNAFVNSLVSSNEFVKVYFFKILAFHELFTTRLALYNNFVVSD